MSDLVDRLRNALSERYAVERELGSGGMATVYLAEDIKHGRKVAIKLLRPELAASIGAGRFLREIEIAAKLTHPNILSLYDSGEADGLLFYVMPFMEGETLRHKLDCDKQLPIEDATRIACEVADALESAHKRGVIHRDIKPENILLEAGHALVADFGIARAVSVAGGEQLTETGTAVGTPAYMSPEQAMAEEVDARSDIYSLASVLYEMLSGEPPYPGSTPQAILAKKLAEPVPSVRVLRETVPANLDQALHKALAKTPADRFATASEFSQALAKTSDRDTDELLARKGLLATPVRAAIAFTLVIAVFALWWYGVYGRVDTQVIDSTADNVAFGLERLVVLPFQDLTGDITKEHMVDGLTEGLTSELARSASLEVRSRTSAMRYKGSELSTPEIARELGVDGLVEGSIMGWRDTVHVVVQLIDAEQDAHRWSREYAEPYYRFPRLPGQIARDLLAVLLPDESTTETGGEVRPPTESIVAYELYRQGMRTAARYDQGVHRALDLFNQAIEEDSTFALAYVGLAAVYTMLNEMAGGASARRNLELARQALVTALRLDPNLSEARAQRAGMLMSYEYEYEEAEREFKLGVQLNPSWAWAHGGLGFLLALQGRHEEALFHSREAQRLAPSVAMTTTDLAVVNMMLGDCDRALEEAQGGVRMDPSVLNSYMILAWALSCLERFDEAIETLETHLGPNANATYRGTLGYGYARAGRRTDAERILRELESEHSEQRGSPRAIAWVHAGLGNHDEAIRWFREAIRQQEGWINQDFRLFVTRELWSLPEFNELLREVRLEPW